MGWTWKTEDSIIHTSTNPITGEYLDGDLKYREPGKVRSYFLLGSTDTVFAMGESMAQLTSNLGGAEQSITDPDDPISMWAYRYPEYLIEGLRDHLADNLGDYLADRLIEHINRLAEDGE